MGKRMKEFYAALERGDVVTAVVNAPFQYSSKRTADGYCFAIRSGELAGRIGIASTLEDAVRLAVGAASLSSTRGES